LLQEKTPSEMAGFFCVGVLIAYLTSAAHHRLMMIGYWMRSAKKSGATVDSCAAFFADVLSNGNWP
jgi:hypothetical protein